jgi:hypothetical protein
MRRRVRLRLRPPPRSPIQTEISRCRANSAELVGFRVGDFVSVADRLNVTGLFDAAVSAQQNPVSRKRRPTSVETRSNVNRYYDERRPR